VRIAEALDGVVMQHCRRTGEGRYQPLTPGPETEHVIVLRDARALKAVRPHFPKARFHVWLHDQVARGSTRARWLQTADPLLSGCTLICVSDFLRRNVEPVVRGLSSGSEIALRVIYNPVGDDLAPNGAGIDPDKLLFMSSPNKGLDYTLTAFQAIRRNIGGLKLYVANPGYRQVPRVALPGVEWLGTLAPAQVVEQARSALCVFMPNFLLPETFGLVFAEANAVGTPVLAHDCGAAREVLHDSNPVLAVRTRQRQFALLMRGLAWRGRRFAASAGLRLGVFDDYIELLSHWRAGQRPRVDVSNAFRQNAVVREWQALLR